MVADPSSVADRATLADAADQLGADVLMAQVHAPDDLATHDPGLLAAVFGTIMDAPRPAAGSGE